jgi:hypothetical protein
MHRFYSTRWSVITGAVAMGGWIAYSYYGRGVFRTDLMIIMLIMAAAKLAGMLYYRLTN